MQRQVGPVHGAEGGNGRQEKAISSVHKQNKKLLVWTANEKRSQKHFLCSDTDGIITDEVEQAAEVRDQLAHRTDLQRIIDWIMAVVG